MKNDGGPAFPKPNTKFVDTRGSEAVIVGSDGMTLRDWFAGQALAGLMAPHDGGKPMSDGFYEAVANDAYRHADAMLTARAQEKEKCPE